MSVTDKKIEKPWRTIQFFLHAKDVAESEAGVCEVEGDGSGNFRCNCQVFSSGKVCRHVRFTMKRAESNNGMYPLKVSDKVSPKEIDVARKDPGTFREFVLKYGKIEVL